ncbi:MAG: small ribosomal subunit Rsm22 family protein [Terriglobales bacterium]
MARAAAQITSDYNLGRFAGSLRSPEARVAYLTTRLPATYAANHFVFTEVQKLLPDLNPEDLLDLGAGPGTATWAAREVWGSLASFTLIDSNRAMLELGQQLAPGLPNANWKAANLSSVEFPSADVVILSYALGELTNPTSVIARAWNSVRRVLIVIEPGTPKNFSTVEKIRTQLIAAGAYSVAPCPHVNECPMAAADDWCHFAVRLARTADHRRLKGATLGYEDEKFSYLAFSKSPMQTPPARILRHPAIHSGHIQLTLCTPLGLESQTVTRSDKSSFRAARNAEWGYSWPL